MKWMVALLMITFACGCICCPCWGSGGETDTMPSQTTATMAQAQTTTTYRQPYYETTSFTSSSSTSSTTLAAPPPLPVTTSTFAPGTYRFDYSELDLQELACAEDDFGNAMAAGRVYNPTKKTALDVVVWAQLKDDDGDVVPGGARKVEIASIAPKGGVKFSAVFEKPPEWEKCRIFVQT